MYSFSEPQKTTTFINTYKPHSNIFIFPTSKHLFPDTYWYTCVSVYCIVLKYRILLLPVVGVLCLLWKINKLLELASLIIKISHAIVYSIYSRVNTVFFKVVLYMRIRKKTNQNLFVEHVISCEHGVICLVWFFFQWKCCFVFKKFVRLKRRYMLLILRIYTENHEYQVSTHLHSLCLRGQHNVETAYQIGRI